VNNALIAVWTSVFGSGVACAPDDRMSYGGPMRRAGRETTARPAQISESERGLVTIGGEPSAVVLARLREGNRAALTALHNALYGPLWRLAVILTRSTSVAEEVLQEVFCSLWLRRASLDPEMDARAYLYASVRNQIRQLHRHSRVVADVEDAVGHGALGMPALGTELLAPDQAVEASEFSSAFHHALAALTERERHALQLRIEEELTFDEIGQLLGLSRMGAHKIVARAEAKIRVLLAAYRP
jgi:RNA polymerase sigma-70 factor (ECF subfamily)